MRMVDQEKESRELKGVTKKQSTLKSLATQSRVYYQVKWMESPGCRAKSSATCEWHGRI